mmetsp:Transcript_71138/g.98817  ORF Transcript_71138/g.98817 Transcript_71138/m.98817 type:complete len:143 (-) Transcript_71138:95-523(-)|eukprot:symbB.v1.2.006754.t1/scaffold405.1/size210896/10
MDTLAVGLVLLGIAIFGTVVMFFLFRSKQFQDREAERCASKKLQPLPTLNMDLVESVTLESPETCVICLQAMPAGATARQLGCGHQFHDSCIVTWWKKGLLKTKTATCPTCRHEEIGVIDGRAATDVVGHPVAIDEFVVETL